MTAEQQKVVEELKAIGATVLNEPDGTLRVDLEDTPADDAVLAKVATLPNISFLILTGSKVTDAGLAHVAGMNTVRHLFLSRTGLTDAGMDRRATALRSRDGMGV